MTPDTPTPATNYDADEADVLEQRQSATNDDDIDDDLPDEMPLDADPADVVDQHLAVPIDDDDRPT